MASRSCRSNPITVESLSFNSDAATRAASAERRLSFMAAAAAMPAITPSQTFAQRENTSSTPSSRIMGSRNSCNPRRRASSRPPTTTTTTTTLLLAALCMTATILIWSTTSVQARFGHLDIVNAFRSPTQITCHDSKSSRQTYTATTGEYYYFAFDTDLHEYWDCEIANKAWRLVVTRRFYGDDTHGGPELFGCYDCVWSVQEVGAFFFHDGEWKFWYPWRH